MNHKKRRITFRITLISVLIVSLLASAAVFLGASAAGDEAILREGQCGENVSFRLLQNGQMTISGNGNMYDFDVERDDHEPSWYWDREKITSVVIESNVTSIGNQAFFGCNNLTAITIPSSVSQIGGQVFSYCRKLDQINLAADNPYFTCVDSVIYDSALTRLVVFPVTKGDLNQIPDTVIYLGSFKGSGVTSITLPKGLTSISSEQFANCSRLTNITLPDGLTTIYSSAFGGCSALQSITLPNSLTAIYPGAFEGSGLQDVYFQGSMEEWLQVKKADGTVEEVPITCKPNGIWFEATDFSPYALAWSVSTGSPGTGESNMLTWIAVNLALLSLAGAGAVFCRRQFAARAQ